MSSFFSKIWKLLKLVYLVLFALGLCALLYPVLTSSASAERVLQKELPFYLVVFGLPPLLILWGGFAKSSLRNYLARFANYSPESLAEMSFHELKLRRELYRLDKSTDYSSVAKNDLQATIYQVKEDIKNNSKGLLGGFKAGLDSAGGSGNFYGTPGQRIVCINCGQRMMKSLFGWSTSVKCADEGKKCVPHDATV